MKFLLLQEVGWVPGGGGWVHTPMSLLNCKEGSLGTVVAQQSERICDFSILKSTSVGFSAMVFVGLPGSHAEGNVCSQTTAVGGVSGGWLACHKGRTVWKV